MQFSEQLNASQKNLSYLLAEKLGQQILSGKYPPESILRGEIELAEQFGVSRTAVREAVKCWRRKEWFYRARASAPGDAGDKLEFSRP